MGQIDTIQDDVRARSAFMDIGVVAYFEPQGPDGFRHGAIVDPMDVLVELYFDSQEQRHAWLEAADLGVKALIDPDGTRHNATITHEGWIECA